MNRLRIFLASLSLFLGLGGLVPALAAADTPKSTVCQALQSNATCTQDPPGSIGVNSVITAIVNILSFVVGVAAVIMIIIGGFKMVTSGGDSNRTASGRNTVLYAIIGLVVVAFAQLIVKFVIHNLK